ncbi:MAG TPA: porin [Telluria sp.]|jgi:hypothetical protein
MAEIKFALRGVALAALVLASTTAPARAQDGEQNSAFKLSGFVSVVGGKVLGSHLGDDYVGESALAGVDCPCYTADWHNAGVYDRSFSLEPESRAGLQARYSINRDLSLTTQIVVRGTDPTPNVQWAYAAWSISKNLEMQIGRKRIPLYFYSDFQDIGVSYPWVAVPPELYGWEVANYNGASIRYKGALGDTNFNASLFTGGETLKDSEYYKLFSTGDTKIRWKKLVGGDVELTRGPLTARMVYMQARVRALNPSIELDEGARLKAYGLAVNLDFDDWFMLSELTQLTRDIDADYRVTAPALTIGAGYRIGAWTPFINYARYTERSTDIDAYAPTSWTRASATLRYDLDARSALKLQLDRHRDTTRNFGGDVNVFRIAYDRLF